MSFTVHAAPPPGEWLNDPNGLAFIDGQWRLFVQHSAAAPDFRAIGWARLSSPDLLQWSWDGPVIAPDALGQAYSGSIACEDGLLAAYLTRFDGTMQRQVRLTSNDSGATWTQGPLFGPAGRNVRDPFVFFCAATNDWRMLIAEPCDWTDWARDPPSTLAVWRRDGEDWTFVSRIGPWMEPGILWEVPVIVDFGSCQVLMMSTVDRRDGASACAVRYWPGAFDGADFTPATPGPGLLLDHGPDFYAAIVDCAATRGAGAPTVVAWASSWATARAMPWPGGANGGPITMPRTLAYDAQSGRLGQAAIAAAVPVSSIVWAGPEAMTITVAGEDCTLSVRLEDIGLHVARSGLAGLLDWERRDDNCFQAGVDQTIDIFNDCGLIEIFIRPAGVTMTVYLPGAVF